MGTQASDALQDAVAAWVTEVAKQLDGQQREVIEACLNNPDTDLRVTITLRRGAIELEGINEAANSRIRLFSQKVER